MTVDIKCPSCGTLFGKETSDGSGAVLTIKNRDLYRTFTQGEVWGPCRGCGIIVKWPRKAEDIR